MQAHSSICSCTKLHSLFTFISNYLLFHPHPLSGTLSLSLSPSINLNIISLSLQSSLSLSLSIYTLFLFHFNHQTLAHYICAHTGISTLRMGANDVLARLNSSGFLRTQGFIGGKWVDAYDGKTIQVNNPATGEVIADVACMGTEEANDAIASAYEAFQTWSKVTAAERSKLLRKWYDLIIANKEQLGELITLEQGKPLKEAIGEISLGASYIEFYAEEAKRVYGDIIPTNMPDRRLFLLKQPVGVVGAITPWNFPFAMIARKVAGIPPNSRGPLINEAAVQKVETLLQDAVSKGAEVLLGGKRHGLGFTFYEPTVISNVNNEMRISREEVFGPVAPLLRFKTEEEAISIANDTNAGLAAYLFSSNVQRTWRVAEALEYGIVGINEGLVSSEVTPHGGVKQSGLGREGSKYGMDDYLEIKYVCLGNMC
ncbi:hypothetical protein DCAR_0104934 [Daucus carota subsp. sativus]|uniref:Aldehyde dehydrogenase domain-containing protein n=1 Tax=Daucus carota subsp. sativus TaxID=79200 RepID=A0AAF1AMN3_DAUCS|nr:hypothetical protein DCAR_0104934 [Daucus carota subsp. sativus]